MMCHKPDDRINPEVALAISSLPNSELFNKFSDEEKGLLISAIGEGLNFVYAEKTNKLELTREQKIKLQFAHLVLEHLKDRHTFEENFANSLFAKFIFILTFGKVKTNGFSIKTDKTLKQQKSKISDFIPHISIKAVSP